jgi:hypothetical protein
MPVHTEATSACDAPTREQGSRIVCRSDLRLMSLRATLDDHIPPQHIEGQTSLRQHSITKQIWGSRHPMLLDALSIPATASTCGQQAVHIAST